MFLFAMTGITLNHAAQITVQPKVVRQSEKLPKDLYQSLSAAAFQGKKPLPDVLNDWIRQCWGFKTETSVAEWSDNEIYLSLPRPGGDAWLSIDLDDGTIQYEKTDRGWVSYLNDLHKGRNAGWAWTWFLDLFAVSCLLFCITGLFLLHLHAGSRPTTWPLVGLGLVVPLILAILWIH